MTLSEWTGEWLCYSLIADTRESAAAALNASNAYKSIIDAINKAWNASMEAVKTADEAKAVSHWLMSFLSYFLTDFLCYTALSVIVQCVVIITIVNGVW